MGLATSQVRLLSLTSRKADVELQMELDSKRKTTLTRQATNLAKQYYSKLQNTTVQYSTTNGYADVDYSYLMANSNNNFFDQVLTGNGSYSKKTTDGMILTDMYGKVVLDDDLMKVYIAATNKDKGKGTVEDKTLTAINELFQNKPTTTSYAVANGFSAMFSDKLTNSGTEGVKYKALKYMLENGYQQGGAVYQLGANYYDTRATTGSTSRPATDKTVPMVNGTFYQIMNNDGTGAGASAGGNYDYQMYWKDGSTDKFITDLSSTYAKELVNVMKYYGSIFSAAFNNGVSGTFSDKSTITAGTYTNVSNTPYKNASKSEALQAGLKSGVFQLVNVDSAATGHYAKAQNLDYFITSNLVAENTDESKKEEITAWYNSEKADLDEKESYWDTEITQLSTELNTITTEVDSVKSLRDNAISSVFKWGSSA